MPFSTNGSKGPIAEAFDYIFSMSGWTPVEFPKGQLAACPPAFLASGQESNRRKEKEYAKWRMAIRFKIKR